MNKFFLSLASFFLLPLFFASPVSLANSEYGKEPIEVFTRDACVHCISLKEFLDEKSIPYTERNIKNQTELFLEVTSAFELLAGTPIILSGSTIFTGYSDEKIGQEIISRWKNEEQQSFEYALKSPEEISVYSQISGATCLSNEETECVVPQSNSVSVPFFGDIEISTISTSALYGASFIIGFLDGFNPCAMWVLIVFIMTLMQIGDRVKMAFVAGTFLVAQAIMYGLILVLWWKFFNELSAYGFDVWVQMGVGALAIGAGIFFLYEGIFKDGTCQVTDQEQRKSISQKISDIAHSPVSIAAFFGILTLAFSVNIIEFACSAGYPQLFTSQILGGSSVSFIDKIGFLLTYLGAYMLDDIIVFAIALIAIEKLGILQKYGRGFNVFGGGTMVLIGIIMIFFPQLLKAAVA